MGRTSVFNALKKLANENYAGEQYDENKKDLKKILCAVIIVMFLLAFLHELGHCIAVWFYGGRVTKFQFIFLWDAHTNFEGEGLGWKPLIHLAGPLFPVLIVLKCLVMRDLVLLIGGRANLQKTVPMTHTYTNCVTKQELKDFVCTLYDILMQHGRVTGKRSSPV